MTEQNRPEAALGPDRMERVRQRATKITPAVQGIGVVNPHYTDPLVTLYLGDCLEVMRQLPDSSVDSVVTDPPYGLEFMGKEWDKIVPNRGRHSGTDKKHFSERNGFPKGGAPSFAGQSQNPKCENCGKYKFGHRTGDGGGGGKRCECDNPSFRNRHMGAEQQAFHEVWAREAWRVLKPGGYLLAFGGTRTVHRLASAIEDAGFEIRDTLMWIYASGFPKSLDVSKALDKVAGAEREVIGTREVWGLGATRFADKDTPVDGDTSIPITAPATDLARKWEGWGTALKPAHEPIVMARKPLVGTVAANVTRYGVGAINVDACRIPGTEAQEYTVKRLKPGATLNKTGGNWRPEDGPEYHGQTKAGRWPSNVMLGDPELFDEPNPWVVGSGATSVSGWRNEDRPEGAGGVVDSFGAGSVTGQYFGDSGGYSRFFKVPEGECHCDHERPDGEHRPGPGCRMCSDCRAYPTAYIIPKADRAERERGLAGAPKRAVHPTVKPIDLMRHLVRLVTPPGGVVLDPFLGSGTTALAASEEGFRCIGIEREAEYLEIAVGRLMATPMGLGLDVLAPTRRPDILAMTNEDELDNFAEWAASDDALSEGAAPESPDEDAAPVKRPRQRLSGAAPRAEGLDVERLARALHVNVGDRLDYDECPQTLDGWHRKTADILAAEYARLSRPSDERVPEPEATE